MSTEKWTKDAILRYLLTHEMVARDQYRLARLNEQLSNGRYVHEDFLNAVGKQMAQVAIMSGATKLVSIIGMPEYNDIGETLAIFASRHCGLEYTLLNIKSDYPLDDDINQEEVLIISNDVRGGGMFRDAVAICEQIGASVTGGVVLVECGPQKITQHDVDLPRASQSFTALCSVMNLEL